MPVKKQQDAYHHGNLREALIREGLKSLQVDGVKTLSLRKLADRCGVSSAAPYAHFENKEALLDAMEEYVMVELTKDLKLTTQVNVGEGNLLLELGVSYVLFFFNNPTYFTTLFSRSRHMAVIFESSFGSSQSAKGQEMRADLSQTLEPSEVMESDKAERSQVANPAFAILEKLVGPKLGSFGLAEAKVHHYLIASWALVHGLSSIVCTKEVNDKLRAEGGVEDWIRDILSSQRPSLPGSSSSHLR